MRTRFSQRYWRLLLALLAAFSLSACVNFLVSERIFVKPTPDEIQGQGHAQTASTWNLPGNYKAQGVVLARPDSATLHGIWIRNTAPEALDRVTVLYFMGNTARIGHSGANILRELLPLGVDVLMFDHRGSGQSTGPTSFALMRADAIAIYDYALNDLQLPGARVLVHGFSLGSLIAGDLAVHRPLAGLVLDGTGSTPEEYVKYATPWYGKPFVRATYDPSVQGLGNVAAMQTHRGPLLILSGKGDRQAHWKMSQTLYEAAISTQKELVLDPRAGHGELIGTPAARAAYQRLLQRMRAIH